MKDDDILHDIIIYRILSDSNVKGLTKFAHKSLVVSCSVDDSKQYKKSQFSSVQFFFIRENAVRPKP